MGHHAPGRFAWDKKFLLQWAVRFVNSEYTALSRIERGARRGEPTRSGT